MLPLVRCPKATTEKQRTASIVVTKYSNLLLSPWAEHIGFIVENSLLLGLLSTSTGQSPLSLSLTLPKSHARGQNFSKIPGTNCDYCDCVTVIQMKTCNCHPNFRFASLTNGIRQLLFQVSAKLTRMIRRLRT